MCIRDRDDGHDDDQEGGSPELQVLGLSCIASSPDEVDAPDHAETTTDGGYVDNDLEVTVSTLHQGSQVVQGVGQALSLAGVLAAHLNPILSPEGDLLSGSS